MEGNIKLIVIQVDANQGKVTKEPIQVPIRPVTRASAKRFKESVNGLIQSIWAEVNSWRPKDDVILLENPKNKFRKTIFPKTISAVL